jgi:hypothetical protein
VLVGLLGDQLVVATGLTLPVPQEVPLPGVAGLVEGGKVARTRPVDKKYTFKAGENSQYTVSYNEKNKALSIIGHDDLVINFQASDSDCNSQVFSIDNKRVVRILHKEDTLEISELM